MAMMMFDSVVLINRTQRVLDCLFDGDHYPIKPGKNPGWPKIMVGFAKNQNPRMGTQDPYVGKNFESLVGVEGTKDPIDSIDESKGTSVERINRKMVMGQGRFAVPIEGRVFHPSEIMEEDGALSLDTVFGRD